MKVILDTNIIISGIFFSGPPSSILEAWHNGKLKLIISKEIFDEYSMVIERISIKYPGIDIDRILELIAIHSKSVIPNNIDPNICLDASDIKFIESALTSNTKVIISGDKHLLDLNGYNDIEVLRPAEFVSKYL